MTDSAPVVALDPGPRALSRLLNIAGVIIVGFLLWQDVSQHMPPTPLWVWVGSGIALLGWLVRDLLPTGSLVRLIVVLATIAVSTAVALPTDVLGFVPGVVELAILLAAPFRPLALGLTVVGSMAVALAVLGMVFKPEPGVLLGAGVGILLSALVGVSRRQYRVAAVQDRTLLEDRLRLEEERGHTAALAERSRIARDIHDVLAHSLGGLVLQLDAIDALLEAGQTDEAHTRVSAARGLAASGLDEARRAVDALRDPETSADLAGAIADLVVTHRSLGSAATLSTRGTPVVLSSDSAGALRRAAQETLSNARRHAPGQATALKLGWLPNAVTLTATTPLAPGAPGAAPSSSGGGRGLAGLRERMDALGGTADWAVRDGAFEVTARIPVKESS